MAESLTVNYPFRIWIRSALTSTLISVVVSTLGAILVTSLLGYFALASNQSASGNREFFTLPIPQSPTSGTGLLLVIGLLFILSSITSSGVQRIDSLVLRRHLRGFASGLDSHAQNFRGTLVRERILARSWISMLSSAVQPIVFSLLALALLPIAASPFWLLFIGVICGVTIAHWRQAKSVSINFLTTKNELQKEDFDLENANIQSFPGKSHIEILQTLFYQRDAYSLNLPPKMSLLFSFAFLVVFGFPVAQNLSSPDTGAILITLFLLHQKSLIFLSSVGRFAWGLVFWRSRPTIDSADDFNE